MNTKFVTSALFVCVAVLFAVSVGWAFKMQENTDQDEPLETLVGEFRSTLTDLHKHLEQKHEQGLLPYPEFINAQNKLLEDELLVTSDKTERVELLRKRLQNSKSLELSVTAQVQVAEASSTDLLTAKAKRLQAQIELKREDP